MTTIVKSEWHQVEKLYGLDFTVEMVEEVYSDMEEDEIQRRYEEICNGEYSVDDFISDAEAEDVYFDWEWLDEDDWWTERKGGYEVTYEIVDDEEE